MFSRCRRIKLWAAVLTIGVIFIATSLVMAEPKIKLLPPGVPNPDVDFSGITIGAIHDAGAGRILEWYAPLLEKECGVKIRRTEMVDLPKLREKAIGDLIAGKPSWELVEISPKFIADFALTGLIEPLDDYFAKYDEKQVQAYWDDLLPIYKEFYMKWGGKTWTIPFDGDIHLFNYRISLFENPEYKAKFKEMYGKELGPPETWDDFVLLGKFFKEVLPKGMYPTMWWLLPPDGAAFYFDLAASYGVKYFSEDMEIPLWPQDRAIAALAKMVETVPYCPPGVSSFGFTETVDYWLAGKVAFQIWFIDINEWGQMGTPAVKGDVANSLIPGYRDPKLGKVVHRAMSPYNRVWLIPKNLPQKVKEAAFYVAYRLSHKDYSVYTATDLYCGMDPMMYSHYTDEAAVEYTKPNPLRGVAPDWPENELCFSTFEEARKHLDGGLANMEVAFPEICWPGATQYTESLSRWVQRAMSLELTPEEAIEKAAAEWAKIRDTLGKDKQKKYYKEFVDACKRLGYW